ncbi:MAG: DUF2071 domain-containing protein [Verrucomicrobiota bacterium]
MNACELEREPSGGINKEAHERILSRKGEPLFLADWERAVFIHYEIDPEILQSAVPFQLDLRDGKAYVSLVAFTMRRMRPRFGGHLTEWLFKPIATHEFLNVRTYVRHNGEPGIYFLAEWLSNPLSVHLGPGTFGLPYRFGKIEYLHAHEKGELRGTVADTSGRLEYFAEIDPNSEFNPCDKDSLEEFLMERYTAFTRRGSKSRFFRIWHPRWLQTPIEIKILDDGLLTKTWPWLKAARMIRANYSPGVKDVWMGRPHWNHGKSPNAFGVRF